METNSAEKKVAAIPSSVTIGEVTYVVKDTPELQSLIASVSKIEKDKLYSQFEALKTQVNQLGNVQVAPATNAPLDVVALKKEIVDSMTEKIAEIVNPLLRASKDTQQQGLLEYRESLIKANLDKCIPELVKGDTKEALKASLEDSIALRAKYVRQPTEKIVDPLLTEESKRLADEGKEEAAVVLVPKIPKRESPDGFEAPADIKSMSAEEFAQRRDALKTSLETMYPN